MQADYLFVYGTLRRDSSHPMQQLLASNSRYCGRAWFRGKLYDLGGYPGVISSSASQDRIQGDLFQITSHGLFEQLDYYEEVGPSFAQPTEYLRQLVKVESEEAGELSAWIYLHNRPIDRQRQIRSGDYLRENKPRKLR